MSMSVSFLLGDALFNISTDGGACDASICDSLGLSFAGCHVLASSHSLSLSTCESPHGASLSKALGSPYCSDTISFGPPTV